MKKWQQIGNLDRDRSTKEIMMIDQKIYMREKLDVSILEQVITHCESRRYMPLNTPLDRDEAASDFTRFVQPFPSSAICHLSGTPVYREFSST